MARRSAPPRGCLGSCAAGASSCASGLRACGLLLLGGGGHRRGGADPTAAAATRPHRVVRVFLGHFSPVRLRVVLPEDGDRSWTGNKVWPSGLCLADWLARQSSPSVLEGVHVIELGCGSAPLPTAVALLRGAASVVATDGDKTAVSAANDNLRQCGELCPDVATRLRVARLLWEDAAAFSPRGRFDVVLFADGVYTEAAAAALAACVDHCLCAGTKGRVFGVVPDTRVGAAEFCRDMRRRDFAAAEIVLGPSADAERTAVQAVEGCSRDEAVQTGSCRLVQWRRGRPPHGRDDGRRLEQHFERAVVAAEREVDARVRATGCVPEE